MSKAQTGRMALSNRFMTVCLTAVLTFTLCGGPQLANAQQNQATQPQQQQSDPQTQNAQAPDQPSQPAQQPDTATQENSSQSESSVQQQQQTARPGMIDPSKGPLTPAPTNNEPQQQQVQPQDLPDAPSATQGGQQPPDQNQPQKPTRPRSTQPVGVGTAQQAPTAGGAASKPAGAAIAPAKQKQYRSLLIKIGAIAGAGAALGTVYALSRGTKSVPPGAK